jgi:3-oxoacyl-[acyl-carrier protein] reductase
MSEQFFRLDGRAAVVTGGGQSVGEGIARRLTQAGARVCVFDVNDATAREVADSIGGIAVQGDVTSWADVQKCVAACERQLGPVAILVNNAAIGGKVACIWDLAKEDLEQVLAVNVVGPFLFCKAVISGMLERKYGRIVNIASIAGKEGNPTLIPYSASKAALINLTKALSREIAGKGDITVNAISPAVIRTTMLDTVPQATIDYMISKIPMGRTCRIDEVAALVHYLVSAEASFCTGQCYDISGGRATY